VLTVLEQSAAALAGASVLLVAVLVLRRLRLARAESDRRRGEAAMLPMALTLLDETPAEALGLDDRRLRVLAGVLARFARELRGAPRERIATFFEDSGLVARERQALRSRRPWRRAEAARLLGDMSSTCAVSALVSALDDPERDVRAAAARSLGRLGSEAAVQRLVQALAAGRVPYAVAAHALLSIGAPALPQLRRLVDEVAHEVRATAIEVIGLLGDPSDAPLLEGRLRDASAAVRAKAAVGLGRVGAEGSRPALRQALSDRVPFVRAAAAEAIGALGDVEAIPALVDLAVDAHFEPARAAARALAELEPAPDFLLRADAGPHLREAADLALLKAA
jgi:HEAT repeat protein